MSVFINACHSLSALPSLSQFVRDRLSIVAISFYVLLLLFGPSRLLEFTLAGPLSMYILQLSGIRIRNQQHICYALILLPEIINSFVMPSGIMFRPCLENTRLFISVSWVQSPNDRGHCVLHSPSHLRRLQTL